MSELVRVPWKGWKVVSKLGQGSYGTVYEIERTVGSHVEKAAMKVIPIPPDRQVISEYRNEGYDDNSITQMCELYLNRTVEEYTMMRSMKENNNIVSCDDIEYLLKEDSMLKIMLGICIIITKTNLEDIILLFQRILLI